LSNRRTKTLYLLSSSIAFIGVSTSIGPMLMAFNPKVNPSFIQASEFSTTTVVALLLPPPLKIPPTRLFRFHLLHRHQPKSPAPTTKHAPPTAMPAMTPPLIEVLLPLPLPPVLLLLLLVLVLLVGVLVEVASPTEAVGGKEGVVDLVSVGTEAVGMSPLLVR
jgi:hypothetical protein